MRCRQRYAVAGAPVAQSRRTCALVLWLLLMLAANIALPVGAVRESGIATFSLKTSGIGENIATSSKNPLLLQSYYHVLVDDFGLRTSGMAQVNLSTVGIDWAALEALDVAQLLLVSPPVVTALQRYDDSWLARMTAASGGGAEVDNEVSSSPQAMSALCNRTFVFARIYRASTWAASQIDVGTKPCGVPFLASVRLPFAVDANGAVVQAAVTLSVVVASKDFVTVVVVQCSHIPLTVAHHTLLLNDGGVEVSLSEIPYLNLYSFQTAIYLGSLVLWMSYMLHHWHLGEHEAHNNNNGNDNNRRPLEAQTEGWILHCTKTEWLVLAIVFLRTTENLFLVAKNEILQRSSGKADADEAQRLDDASSAAYVISSTLVMYSMMVVGIGWPFTASPLAKGQRYTITMFLVLYIALIIAEVARYTNFDLEVGIGLVYIASILYAVVQLRATIEALRIEMITSTDARTAIAFLRLHSLRVPFGLNVVAVVTAWLLSALLLTDDTSAYLRDAVAEFQVIYWTIVMMVFLRREPVVF